MRCPYCHEVHMGSLQRRVETTEECRDVYFVTVGALYEGDLDRTAKFLEHEDIVQMYLNDGR